MQSAQRQGFTPPPLAYLQTMYRELDAGGNVALFVGHVQGRPVAADLVTVCGGMIRGRFAGFDRPGRGAAQRSRRDPLADHSVGEGPRAAVARLRRAFRGHARRFARRSSWGVLV